VKIDKMVEDSVKVCIKKALNTLATVVNGDGKSEPHPAFRSDIVLDGLTVALLPTYESLIGSVMALAAGMANVCADLGRLPALLVGGHVISRISPHCCSLCGVQCSCQLPAASCQLPAAPHERLLACLEILSRKTSLCQQARVAGFGLTRTFDGFLGLVRRVHLVCRAGAGSQARNVRPRPSYRDVIDADDEYNKMQQLIHNGLLANQPNVQSHIDTWFENYSTIWMTEKDDFIEQYAEVCFFPGCACWPSASPKQRDQCATQAVRNASSAQRKYARDEAGCTSGLGVHPRCLAGCEKARELGPLLFTPTRVSRPLACHATCHTFVCHAYSLVTRGLCCSTSTVELVVAVGRAAT
jgi:hypothetical protein